MDTPPLPNTDSRDWLDRHGPHQIDAAATRIYELSIANDLAMPVQHLSRWKVRDVVAHLGGIHRWAGRVLTERSMAVPGAKKSKLAGSELCEWFVEGATDLGELFAELDADDACPNFNPGSERTVRWWVRRQLHETTVHRWDVEAASDSLSDIDSRLAADGIDEFLDVFVRTRGKQTLNSTLVLALDDPDLDASDHAWTLTPAEKPGRIDVAHGRVSTDGAATTEVTGSANLLYLALWGRLSIEAAGLAIDGDPDAAGSLLRFEES